MTRTSSDPTPPTRLAVVNRKVTVIRLDNYGLLNAEPRGEQAAIHRSNHQESPLLRLPGELRNRIYEFAIGGSIRHITPSYIPGSQTYNPQPPPQLSCQCDRSTCLCFSLLQVCRQVYEEARLLPFSSNVFWYCNESNQPLFAHADLAVRSQIRAVRKIRLAFPKIDYNHQQLPSHTFEDMRAFTGLSEVDIVVYSEDRGMGEGQVEDVRAYGKELEDKAKAILKPDVKVLMRHHLGIYSCTSVRRTYFG